MKKVKRFIVVIIFMIINVYLYSATIYVPAGPVYNVTPRINLWDGPWTIVNTYVIQGNIYTPSGQTLTIDPGVSISFEPTYQYDVYGILDAGSLGSGVTTTFTAYSSPIVRWNGIKFHSTGSGTLYKCIIEYSGDCAVQVLSTNNVDISRCNIRYNTGTNGAGIYLYESDITIEQCVIHYNSATTGGGGIYCDNSDPTIQNNTISNNDAYEGGGIFCNILSSSSTILHNIIEENVAEVNGGGIYCTTSSPTIEKNNINSNVAYDGAGIYLTENSDAYVFNNLIHINNESATIHNGGGIYCNESDPEITDNYIDSNEVSNFGGGIFITNSTPDIHDNLKIIYNKALKGGGLYCDEAGGTYYDENFIQYNYASEDGGGIYLYQGTVTLDNVTITNNDADNDGGGVYFDDCSNYSNIANSDINYNTADYDNNGDGNGGGIYSRGATQSNYHYIDGNNILWNVAFKGGGIACFDGTEVQIDGQNYIKNNHAYYGGGIYCEGSPILIRFHNTISYNHAIQDGSYANSGFGGGIYFLNSDIQITYYDTIKNNEADVQGGGIYGGLESDVYICQSTIINNNGGGLGGGIFLELTWNNSQKHPHIINNLIAQNYSTTQGGGICFNGDNKAEVYSNTIADNYCTGIYSVGGGIYSSVDDGTYINNIVWGNYADIINFYNLSTLLWNSSTCDNFSESDIQGCSTLYGNINADPLFWYPATYNYRLDGSASPCIDEGDDSYAWWGYDLDEVTRIIDALPSTPDDVDMGCYENEGQGTPYWIIIFDPNNLTINEGNDNISNIKIYPNPANEYINVKLNVKEIGLVFLKIYNGQGQLVFKKSEYYDENNSVFKLDIKGLPQGIYSVEIMINGILHHGKIDVY